VEAPAVAVAADVVVLGRIVRPPAVRVIMAIWCSCRGCGCSVMVVVMVMTVLRGTRSARPGGSHSGGDRVSPAGRDAPTVGVMMSLGGIVG